MSLFPRYCRECQHMRTRLNAITFSLATAEAKLHILQEQHETLLRNYELLDEGLINANKGRERAEEEMLQLREKLKNK